MSDIDTIVAVATPPGIGGVGIVRVSGPMVPALSTAVLTRVPRPRVATLSEFRDTHNEIIDQGIAIFFPRPHSFTGEDVLELQGHGGPVVMDMLVKALVTSGARLARPGEFSERAFLNNKIDLSQAEAIADLIESGSEAAARSALRSLQGQLSARVKTIVNELIDLRTHVEAAIDFPEEEIDFLADKKISRHLGAIKNQIQQLLADTRQGCLLHDGMTVVLVGEPNAGKSSLLNALAQQDTAIVSNIPGTTRDIVRAQIQIDGLPIHVLDTAGLRVGGDDIENEGMRRTRAAMAKSDRILLLLDESNDSKNPGFRAELLTDLPTNIGITVIKTKCDLTGVDPGITENNADVEICLSVKTGAGLEHLRQHLKQIMGFQSAGEGTFMARRRHLDALGRAEACLQRCSLCLENAKAGELLAEELRLAQQALGEITGEFNADQLLGAIFSSFCIGK